MKWLSKFFLVLSCIFAASCSDNLFEGNIANDSSKEAQEVKLQQALDDRDYQFIIGKLGSKPVGELNDREKYILQCAYIGDTGMSVIDEIGAFLDNDRDLTDAIMGTISKKFPSPTNDTIDNVRASYSKVKDLAAGSTDKDILFAAGIGATLDTFMLTAKIASSLGGSQFDFDPNSPNYIGKKFGNLQASNVSADMVTDIIANVEALKSAIPDSGKEMKEKLDEYLYELTGGTNDTTGVSDSQVVDFINKYIKK